MSRRHRAIAASLLGAALLFTVQPYVARLVLPRLGGSPTVWSICQVFFQAALLLGYGYAHATTRWLTPRQQAGLHLVVLLLPLAALPIGVPAGWAPPGDADPTTSLLSLLARAVLLPFAVVSTTAPLIQRWYARSGEPDAAQPYSLYAASNLGSLVGLLAYPLLIEPTMRLGVQGKAWAAGYVAFIAAVASCAWPSLRGTDVEPAPAPADGATASAAGEAPAPAGIGARQAARWIALSAAPSALLLGVTAHITTDVLSAPLLWALPLALYLVTFIHAFAARPWLSPERLAASLPWVVGVAGVVLVAAPYTTLIPAWLALPVHLLALLAVAGACHGALAAARPAASGLTAYYLLISVGGVIGGVVGGLLPPLVLRSVGEYPAALVVACLLIRDPVPGAKEADWSTVASRRPLFMALGLGVVVVLARVAALEAAARPGLAWVGHPALVPALGVLGAIAYGVVDLGALRPHAHPRRFGVALAAVLFGVHADLQSLLHVEEGYSVVDRDRSFFGVHRVLSLPIGNGRGLHLLQHGTTLHGAQESDPVVDQPTHPEEPLTYFSRPGPIGWAMEGLKARPQGAPRRVAVVGLGAGALAAWAEAGQEWTYFEIDPVVVRVANDVNLFSYLAGARARGAKVPPAILGDARITIARVPEGSFDLLILDAFTSDSVPAHLLTHEAFAGWTRALAPGGVILCNVTNRALQGVPRLVGHLAADAGLVARLAVDKDALPPDSPDPARIFRSRSRWIVMARAEADLGGIAADPRFAPHPGDAARAWTDDFSSILDLLW